MKRFYIFFLAIACFSCNEDYIPKPKAFLRLEYPTPNYSEPHLKKLPFTFETNQLARQIEIKPLRASTESYGLNIEYSDLKGTIFLTYKAVGNNKKPGACARKT